ncbi:MAG: PilZ domain-containing protein [Desulfobacterales bacterium]
MDKRKHRRFSPKQKTLAVLGNKYTRVGKVIDISISGLSFEYIVGENMKIDSTKLDIFTFENIFHLFNISCEIIYNIRIHIPYVSDQYINALTSRRCGLKFDTLPNDDYLHLKYFIENNSTEFSG